MDTVFINSKNSKNSDSHRLLLNLLEKLNLKRSDRYLSLSDLIIYYTWKNIKKSCKNNKYKISTPTWNEEWIKLLIIFCNRYLRLFWIYLKEHGEKTDNLSIRIYVNKIKNRMTFKIKTGYYLKLLTPEKMKLLGSTENKITKTGKYGESVSYLEITEVVLVHCDDANNNYQEDSRVLYTFVPNNLFGQLLDIFQFRISVHWSMVYWSKT